MTKSFRVLVIDSSSMMRDIYRDMLDGFGFIDHSIVSSSADAEVYLNTGVDFVISGWDLGDESVLDFLARRKENPAWKKIPFLVVGSETKPSMVVSVAHEGADGYMVKPVTPEGLSKKMISIAEKKGVKI